MKTFPTLVLLAFFLASCSDSSPTAEPTEDAPSTLAPPALEDDPTEQQPPSDLPPVDEDSDAPLDDQPIDDGGQPANEEPPGDDQQPADEDTSGDEDQSGNEDTTGDDQQPADEETSGDEDQSDNEDTTSDDDQTADDESVSDDDSLIEDIGREASLILGYTGAQAEGVVLKINQRYFSGTLEDEDLACISPNPLEGEPILEINCDPAHPVVDGFLNEAAVISTDGEQGREDDHAACKADLLNGVSDQCTPSMIELTYTPLELDYTLIFDGIDDPIIFITKDELMCGISYEFGSFDDFGSPCFLLVEEFADTIESRSSPIAVATMTETGKKLIARARANSVKRQ